MEPIIEAYAIGFKLLADLIRDLLNALKCLMMHIVAILAFPIHFLAITFYTIVMTLMDVAPRQDFPHLPSMPTHTRPTLSSAELEGLVDVEGSVQHEGSSNNISEWSFIRNGVDWRGKTPDGRVKSAPIGHLRIVPSNSPSASYHSFSPPPAIPPHLKDCEFYYNDVGVDLVGKSPVPDDGGQPIMRITVDGQSHHYVPESAKTFLHSLESLRMVTVNEAGGRDVGEEKRGKLELRDRVYVGPARWLLRVLIEEL